MADWEIRRHYIAALGALRKEISREMDRAQVGEELPRHSALRDAIEDVLHQHGRIIRDQENRDPICKSDGCAEPGYVFGWCSAHSKWGNEAPPRLQAL